MSFISIPGSDAGCEGGITRGDEPPLICLSGIGKSFGNVVALENINFALKQNEIVGLIGDNGAGKSTLIKILSGVITPDSGVFYIKNKRVDVKRYTVSLARRFGIETVHQERALGDKQPIWRNFFMGRQITNSFGMINVRKEKAETMMVLRDVLGLAGVGVTPDSSVATLSGGERQGLAIGRAMYFDADIVILDEPTTALAVREVEKVLSFIRQIRDKGKSCIFISHNLSHIYDVADRFVFVDHGKIVGNYLKSEISLRSLTDIMVGGINE